MFFQGLAKFFYDNRLIHGPSVHVLGKLAITKIGNEWIQIQSTTLEIRKQRQQRIDPLIAEDNTNMILTSPNTITNNNTDSEIKRIQLSNKLQQNKNLPAKMIQPISSIPSEEAEDTM